MDAENAEINELIRKVVHDLLGFWSQFELLQILELLGLKAYTLLFQTAFI